MKSGFVSALPCVAFVGVEIHIDSIHVGTRSEFRPETQRRGRVRVFLNNTRTHTHTNTLNTKNAIAFGSVGSSVFFCCLGAVLLLKLVLVGSSIDVASPF